MSKAAIVIYGTAQRQRRERSRLTRSSLDDWLLETRRSSIHTRVIDDSKSPRKQSLEINSAFRAFMLQLINALRETRIWPGDT